MNKELKNDIQLVKPRENSSETLEAPEQSFNFVALFVHRSVVLPRIQAIAFRRNNWRHTEIQTPVGEFHHLHKPLSMMTCVPSQPQFLRLFSSLRLQARHQPVPATTKRLLLCHHFHPAIIQELM